MYELNEYIEKMKNAGYTQWKIGWESIPKYIGHKIYNTRTKKVGILEWDNGPLIKMEDGSIDIPYCSEFRHSSGEWIYKIGEDYFVYK